MPNIEILSRLGPSEVLNAIKSSNIKKVEREARNDKTVAASGYETAPVPLVDVEKQRSPRLARA
jgi:hypothetical protein